MSEGIIKFTKAMVDAAVDAVILPLVMLLVDWSYGEVRSATHYGILAAATLAAMTLRNLLKGASEAS